MARPIIKRPASKAAPSTLYGEILLAISSAFRKKSIRSFSDSKTLAAVVLPAPFGPPRMTISFTINYAGCNTFLLLFFAAFFAAGLAAVFSTTGPCVSTVGRGGASPMRLE